MIIVTDPTTMSHIDALIIDEPFMGILVFSLKVFAQTIIHQLASNIKNGFIFEDLLLSVHVWVMLKDLYEDVHSSTSRPCG